MAFEKYILPDKYTGEKKMPIHLFTAILSEYLIENQTGADAKDAIEAKVGTLSANESLDVVNLLAYISGGVDLAEKQARMRELDSVLICAEAGTWYGTRELLKTRLNLI